MRSRARLLVGLAAAIAIGLLGPSLSAVASHSGSGTATISGVLYAEGSPYGGGCISAWFSRPDRLVRNPLDPEDEIYAGSTHPTWWYDGAYRLERLAPDTYKVEFHDCRAPRVEGVRATDPFSFQSRWWPDATSYEGAGEIIVGPDAHVTGIDGNIVRIR